MSEMKAVIYLDVPDWQIGQDVSVYFPDTMMKHGKCELLKEHDAVEPKTGHWIWLQYCANEGVYCSECHTKMFDRYPMKKKSSQFCGHCGAKMDDEVEGR